MGRFLINGLMVLSIATFTSHAFGQAMGTAVRISGRAEVVVADPTIKLQHIADIDSTRIQDDEALIELRNIVIAQSPKAGERVVLEGEKVLEKLRNQGVRLDQVRYTFPRQISVTRAYRELMSDELERAVSMFLGRSEKQVELRKLVMGSPVKVPADANAVEVVDLKVTAPGHIGVDFKAASNSEDVRFSLKGLADEWKLLPVAASPVKRGDIITGEVIEMKKVNGTGISRDVLENIGDIVGHSVTRDIGQGEMFRQGAVVVPPVVRAGSKVTLVFRQGGLEATATGTATESGILGQEIKVQNESSRKLVVGKVIEPGMVSVGGNL
jgi:flagella basal body P-ring formation protein FlgA